MDKRDRNIFENYVEDTTLQREQTREKFKQKYLKIGRSEAASLGFSPTDEPVAVEKQYLDFLDHQIQLSTQRTSSKDHVDPSLSRINNNVDIPDSSPAYLGRNPLSNDRERQLKIVDRVLHFRPSHLATEGSQQHRSLIIGGS